MHRKSVLILVAFAVISTLSGGCRALFLDDTGSNIAPGHELENPLVVAFVDREWIMNAISDEVDNYFRIYREERIKLIDSVMTEGWIETHSLIGATALEPWRRDSMPGFERAHATLQTVRRFAKIRVVPNGDSYLVFVNVYKELEDLPEPQHSSVSGRILRHDNSVDIDNDEQPIIQPNRGWIPMGRDFSLEQHILRNIKSAVEKQCQE